MTSFLDRLTSRKFLLALAAFTVAVLSVVGLIPSDQEVQIAGFIAAVLYVIVEGVRDAKAA